MMDLDPIKVRMISTRMITLGCNLDKKSTWSDTEHVFSLVKSLKMETKTF